jgi:demethoxyubiquinone hydroxylase (CLK1/Coq7/Cat5 family)
LTVLYDGGCPLCSREIAWYRGLPARCRIVWQDASSVPEHALPPGVSQRAALARLHVVRGDGSLHTGAAAFIALWSQLLPLRQFARLASMPPMPWLLERAYRLFLRLRPSVQRIVADPPASRFPRWLERDLRSDHAGETGAVWIYRGMLAVSHSSALRRFARSHLRTELRRLRWIEALLEPAQRSRLLPLWRVAGWLTGAVPAALGARAAYLTVAAVERFVDTHYRKQIARLDGDLALADVRALLECCRGDEVRHRHEAAARLTHAAGPLGRAWSALVAGGSAVAVAAARRC